MYFWKDAAQVMRAMLDEASLLRSSRLRSSHSEVFTKFWRRSEKGFFEAVGSRDGDTADQRSMVSMLQVLVLRLLEFMQKERISKLIMQQLKLKIFALIKKVIMTWLLV